MGISLDLEEHLREVTSDTAVPVIIQVPLDFEGKHRLARYFKELGVENFTFTKDNVVYAKLVRGIIYDLETLGYFDYGISYILSIKADRRGFNITRVNPASALHLY